MSSLHGTALKGLAVAALALAGLATSAQAADELSLDNRSGFYVGAKGGYVITSGSIEETSRGFDLTPDKAYLAAGQVGYNMGAFRVEVEAVYAWTSGSDSGSGTFNGIIEGTQVTADVDVDYEAIAPMVNVFYDFTLADRLTGYVGGGVGAVFTSTDASADITVNDRVISLEASNDDSGLAYQFMAGVGYQIADKVTLTLGYRAFGQTIETSFWLNTIEAGVRFDF